MNFKEELMCLEDILINNTKTFLGLILFYNATIYRDYQTTLPASWEICMQVKKQQLEGDMEKGLVLNWERSTSRLYIVTLLI